MTSIIHDFRSIRRKLERQEQKAEFEEKNPKVEPSMYGWPYGVAVPLTGCASPAVDAKYIRVYGGAVSPAIGCASPLKSMAHPEWPYAGTAFEWSKFVKVKI